MKMECLLNENPAQKNDGTKVEKGERQALSVRGAGLAQHIRGDPPREAPSAIQTAIHKATQA